MDGVRKDDSSPGGPTATKSEVNNDRPPYQQTRFTVEYATASLNRKRLEQARQELIAAIDVLPVEEKAAFEEARARVPNLVQKESSFDLFLTVEDFNPTLAAERLARHWKIRKSVFGDDAFRPMDMSPEGALCDGDLDMMERAIFAQLPNDSEGRPVVCIDPSRLDNLPISDDLVDKHRIRVFFYNLHKIAMENPQAQTKGIVVIRLIDISNFTATRLKKTSHVLQYCMAFTTHKFHFSCAQSSSHEKKYVMTRVAPMITEIVGKNSSDRVAVHIGKPAALLKSLCKHGFSQEGLPAKLGGSWSYDGFVNMVQSVRARDRGSRTEHNQLPEQKQTHGSGEGYKPEQIQIFLEGAETTMSEAKEAAAAAAAATATRICSDINRNAAIEAEDAQTPGKRKRGDGQRFKELQGENKKLKAMLHEQVQKQLYPTPSEVKPSVSCFHVAPTPPHGAMFLKALLSGFPREVRPDVQSKSAALNRILILAKQLRQQHAAAHSSADGPLSDVHGPDVSVPSATARSSDIRLSQSTEAAAAGLAQKFLKLQQLSDQRSRIAESATETHGAQSAEIEKPGVIAGMAKTVDEEWISYLPQPYQNRSIDEFRRDVSAAEGSNVTTESSTKASITEKTREELIAAIDALPVEDKAALEEAMARVPNLVEEESNLDLFLTVEDCNPKAAAERLARHWEIRKNIFGDDAFSPMDMSPEGALSEVDLDMMERAVFAQLPNDSEGRPVLFSDPSRQQSAATSDEVMKHRLRMLFNILHKIAMENVQAQTHGLVFMRHIDPSQFDPMHFKKTIHVMKNCMAVKVCMFHFCCSPSSPQEKKHVLARVAPILIEAVGKDSSHCVVVHTGKPASLLQSLCKYGMSREGLPAQFGGSWSYGEFVNMVRSMRARHRRSVTRDLASQPLAKLKDCSSDKAYKPEPIQLFLEGAETAMSEAKKAAAATTAMRRSSDTKKNTVNSEKPQMPGMQKSGDGQRLKEVQGENERLKAMLREEVQRQLHPTLPESPLHVSNPHVAQPPHGAMFLKALVGGLPREVRPDVQSKSAALNRILRLAKELRQQHAAAQGCNIRPSSPLTEAAATARRAPNHLLNFQQLTRPVESVTLSQVAQGASMEKTVVIASMAKNVDEEWIWYLPQPNQNPRMDAVRPDDFCWGG